MTLARLSRLLAFSCALCAAALSASPACAGDDGRSVVILVNAASPDSLAVGAHYAKTRGVPEQNICRINCSTAETVSRAEFETQIRAPLRTFLVDRKLAAQAPDGQLALSVRYLVSAWGVPVKVREDYAGAKAADLPRRPLERNEAAVDSELCLIALPKHPLAGWARNPAYGAPAPPPGLLLATRLDGPSPEIASGLVDAAVQAERDGLLGIGYIDSASFQNATYRTGDEWLLAAGSALKAAGFFTRVDFAPDSFPQDMPMPHAAFYFGWYEPALCGPMAKKDFRFAPGAVAYHLHSASAARLRTDHAGWAGPLLAKGAAATMGAVFEPLLEGTVDVGQFARLFLSGKTYAESVYGATPHLSWMMTFVGDPLYAPFKPDRWPQALDRPENRQWHDLRDAVLAADAGRTDAALQICARHQADPLFTELAGRTLFQARRPDDAMTSYRTLAKLVTDEYAAVQAHAVVGDWLANQGRLPAALDAYVECVRAHPKSPHALPLYRKALKVARALHSTDSELALWTELAANFPEKPLGQFAAAELWARGLAPDCRLPRLEVHLAEARPAIDAQPLDPAWKTAVVAALPWSAGAPRRGRRVSVRLAYDRSALYLLAEVLSEHPAETADPAADESLELTISPWRDADRAVRVLLHRTGAAAVPAKEVVARVGAIRTTAGDRTADIGWLAEVEIPFAALGVDPPEAGAIWAANFVQRSSVSTFPFRLVRTVTAWAPVDADPTPPDCVGLLVFR